MARKKTMATAKKKNNKLGSFLEFYRAISGFWPVWLSTVLIVGGVFGYQYYMLHSNNVETQKSAVENTNNHVSIKQIKIVGRLKYIDPAVIKQQLSKNVKSGLLSSDLTQIKSFIESQAWVKSVTVKRLPADILQLHIEEQKPMLRWKNKGLISVEGKLFEPKKITEFSQMPSIISDKDDIPKGLEILKESLSILNKLKLNLAQIKQDKLGAWELKTTQGVVFKFGRKKLQHRLKVLEKIWPSAVQKGPLKIVDLRYPNGAAVSYL